MATYTGDGGDNSYSGTGDADQITGGGGNDALAGGGGADTIDGDDGNDALFSGTLSPNWTNPSATPILDVGSEIDVLRGLAGDDFLFAGYGDFVDGGADYDTLFISFRGASAGITANFATLVAGGTLTIGGGTIKAIERVLWVEGSQFADTITMSNGDPSAPAYGLGGDDHIVATGGMGEIWGGEGNDTIDASNNFYSRPVYGEAGNDIILAGGGFTYGGIGNDTITGGGRLFGEDGNDTLTATAPSFVYAGAGDDDVTGSFAGDVLSGGEGADTIDGGGGADTIYSATLPEATGDYFDHGAEHDLIDAGAGDDSVIIGYGDDADGGDGIDSLAITLDGAPGGVTLDINIAGSGFGGIGNIVNFERLDVLSGTAFADTIRIGAFADRVQVSGGDGDDRLTATTTSVYFLAGRGDDILTGGSAADALDGSLGNDTLIGGDGADSMDGGDDDDLFEGGLGDDTIRGGQGNDTVTYAHASGAVIINMNSGLPNATGADGFDTFENIENAIGSAFDDDLSGDFFANRLDGGDGNDRLNGNQGADMLTGGLGNDTFVVDNVGDQVVEAAGQGTDTVESSITFVLGTTLEHLTLTGSASIDGTGNGSANIIRGNDGANRLDGLGGDDELHGGGGDDLLHGGGGADVVNGGAGKDTAFVVGGTSNADTALDIVALGGDVDRLDVDYSQITQNVVLANLSFGPNGAQGNFEIGGANRLSFSEIEQLTIVTGSGNDTIYGLSASDQISTGGGNDNIYSAAGAGIDRIDGGSGTDVAFNVDWSDLTAGQAVVLDANGPGAVIGGGASQRSLLGIEQLINFTTGAGNDVITFSTDATLRNTIATGAGSDTVTYHGGATAAATATASSVDMGTGGAEDDLLIVDFAAATQSVTDIVGASAGTVLINNVTVLSFTGVERLWLTTGAAADELYGAAGADRLTGGGGDDLYHVDQAADLVVEAASAGNDRVIASVSYVLGATSEVETLEAVAGSAAINLTGNLFAQTLIGNAGANILDGGGGADRLEGGAGDDLYHVDNAADLVVEAAGQGNDRVVASASYALGAASDVETLEAVSGTAAINLTGNGLAQTITGNAGANALDGGGGTDTLIGLAGNDAYIVDGADDLVVEAAGQGNDRITTSASYVLAANSEIETLEAVAGTAAIGLTGNQFAQTLIGNAGANILDGGGGADRLEGGAGDDLYHVDNGADLVVEAAGAGNDRIVAGVSYGLGATLDVETLEAASGTAAINLTGNGLAQAITGNAGANVLNGGGGADMLTGLAGDDAYIVDGDDVVVEAAGQGYDTVYTTASYTLANGRSIEVLSTADWAGTTPFALGGNELANTLYGNAGHNVLDGGGGADTLNGLGGDDVYILDNAGDAVVEAAGGGYDTIFTAVSYALAAGVSAEVLSVIDWTATGAMNLTGNALANRLYGNAGANVLTGGEGDDVLWGLGGGDTLIGGVGDDVYWIYALDDGITETGGNGYDTAYLFTSYALGADANVEVVSTFNWLGFEAINLTANGLSNTVYGNAGVNTLNGGAGADLLVGLGGADTFAFTTALGGGNVDTIADFVHGTDKVALDDAIFTQIGALGALNANAFVIGSAAGDADDRIVYNSSTGALFYDADGNGVGAAVQFATLSPGLALTASDFQMI